MDKQIPYYKSDVFKATLLSLLVVSLGLFWLHMYFKTTITKAEPTRCSYII